jgi:hypothetical protein
MSGNKIYFNVNLTNDITKSVRGSPTPAIFEQTRTEAIVDNPSKYNLSVVRFTIPTVNIPIKFFPVIYNPADPTAINYSAYSITLRHNNIDYIEHLTWVTQNPGAQLPNPPNPLPNAQVYNNPDYYLYYSMFSFRHFSHLINEALERAMNNIIPFLPVPTPGKIYNPPYMVFDGNSFLYTFYTSELFLEETVQLGNGIELFFNTELAGNFDTSFNTQRYPYSNIHKNLRFIFNDPGNTFQIPSSTEESGFLHMFEQEFDSTGLMSSLKNIIIRSKTLPVRNESISSTKQTDLISGQTISILTDFEIDNSTLKNQKNSITYLPSAEYRRINLMGHTGIRHVALEILWGDEDGNIYPLLIPPNNPANIKILFEEKSNLFDNKHINV